MILLTMNDAIFYHVKFVYNCGVTYTLYRYVSHLEFKTQIPLINTFNEFKSLRVYSLSFDYSNFF